MQSNSDIVIKDLTLDPKNWDEMRKLGHQMIDDVMDFLQNIHKQPAWKPVPEEIDVIYLNFIYN